MIEDLDLIAVQTRSSFFLRRRIAAARHVEELAAGGAGVETGRDRDARRPGGPDQHHRRVLGRGGRADPAAAGAGGGRAGSATRLRSRGWRWAAWPAARRPRAPTSTARSCGSGTRPATWRTPYLQRAGRARRSADSSCAAFVPTPTAPRPRTRCSCVRCSPGSARRGAGSRTRRQEKALILASVLVDSRPVWGVHTGTPVADTFRLAPGESPAAAADGALRPLASSADRLLPRPGGRARRRAPGPAGSQARRAAADRRPRPLGGDGGRRDQRRDDRAPARRRCGRRRCPPPTPTRSRTRSS